MLLFILGLIIGGGVGFLVCAVFSASRSDKSAPGIGSRKAWGKDPADE